MFSTSLWAIWDGSWLWHWSYNQINTWTDLVNQDSYTPPLHRFKITLQLPRQARNHAREEINGRPNVLTTVVQASGDNWNQVDWRSQQPCWRHDKVEAMPSTTRPDCLNANRSHDLVMWPVSLPTLGPTFHRVCRGLRGLPEWPVSQSLISTDWLTDN
jgi:hypothetical protein